MGKLRLILFCAWTVFGVLTLALGIAACSGRNLLLTQSDIPKVLKSLVGLWLPILGCFSAFWYQAKVEDDHKLQVGQLAAAILFSGLYFFMAMVFIWDPLFGTLAKDADGVPVGGGPITHLNDAVTSLFAISPVLLGPVAWLTGKTPQTAKTTSDSHP